MCGERGGELAAAVAAAFVLIDGGCGEGEREAMSIELKCLT